MGIICAKNRYNLCVKKVGRLFCDKESMQQEHKRSSGIPLISLHSPTYAVLPKCNLHN